MKKYVFYAPESWKESLFYTVLGTASSAIGFLIASVAVTTNSAHIIKWAIFTFSLLPLILGIGIWAGILLPDFFCSLQTYLMMALEYDVEVE